VAPGVRADSGDQGRISGVDILVLRQRAPEADPGRLPVATARPAAEKIP